MAGHMKRSHKRKSRRSRRTRKRRGGNECMRKAIAKCAEATKAMGAAKDQAKKASGVFAKKYAKGLASAEKATEAKVAAMKKDASKIVKKGSVAERMKAFQGGKRRRKSKRRRSRKKSRKSRRKSRKTKRRRKSKRRRSRRRRR